MSQIYLERRTFADAVIVSPPYLAVGLTFLIAAALIALFGFGWLFRQKGTVHPLGWWAVVILLTPFLIVGAWLSTTRTQLVLSRSDRSLSVVKKVCWIPVHSAVYDLDHVRSAKVGYGDVCHSLFLVLDDGSTADLIGCTDRPGYGLAAQTINSFIGYGE